MPGSVPTSPTSGLQGKRKDPDVARRILERLYPDEGLRHRLISILAGSIEHAHRVNPAGWSLTLGADERYVCLNVGRIFVLSFQRDTVNVTYKDVGSNAPPVRIPRDASNKEAGRMRVLPEVVWRRFGVAEALERWKELEAAHFEAVTEAASQAKRTPFFPSHSSGLITALGEILNRDLPAPEHGDEATEGLSKRNLERLLELVRRHYPRWDGFRHPKFVHDETDYKQTAIERARELLGREAFAALLREQQFEEITNRLESVGKSVNLLYLGVPSQGDLAVLYDSRLDRPTFCEAVFDLLHGEGESHFRLGRFSDYLESHELPNKWTFPTFFLFFTHPEREMFVKPRVMRWFLELIGARGLYTPRPSAEVYAAILELCGQLRAELAGFEPRDMVDIQSWLWVAHSVHRSPPPLPDSKTGASPDVRPIVSLAECASATGLDQDLLESWVRALQRKKQAILYGPPGTGKTYTARHLARHLAGGGDGLVELVQFHPAYSYEDFIQGIRPEASQDGGLAYRLHKGRFLDFCERARERAGPSVLIIDEINRAPLARVFGELMYLLEYRDEEIPLAGGRSFAIPENVRLLGTMNTADRSIALVDHALRRRFAFLHLRPEPEILRRFHRDDEYPVERLIDVLARLNHEIGDPHYEVGVTFFLCSPLAEEIEDVWRMEIEPYLEELFFDQPETLEAFRWDRVSKDLEP